VRVERLTREQTRSLGGPDGVARHLRSLVPEPASVSGTVGEIVADVRARGEEAVLEWTRNLDTHGADVRPLRVPAGELDEAIKGLPRDVVAGLQVAIANVARVAQASSGAEAELALPQGQRIRLREQPVRSAAVYVPGGRAPYPSTVVMGVVTARSAGVVDVCVCSPPGPSGQIDTALLGTCRLLGVEQVYRMGGAQAVAALAHGTESVAPVDVIVGPGNLFVQEAKRQLSGVVGIDGFAGPSDLLVILAADGDPELAALDLAAQAEHGPGSLVAAISNEVPVLEALADSLAELAPETAGLEPAGCVLIESADLGEALRIAEGFAPEHLQLMGKAAEALAPRVGSAGCLFVGNASATAFGDYVAGSNHILPTAGAARFSSGLAPRHFRRRMSEVHIGPAAPLLAAAAGPIARAEGFELHARSMEARADQAEATDWVENQQ
jgi:histidinol dehydrogenase